MGLSKDFEQDIKQKRWNEMKAAIGRQVQSSKSGDNMTLDELLLNVKAVGLDSIVCQTEIKTEEDKKSYQSQGYQTMLTLDEFTSKYEVDPQHIWYTPSFSFSCFYFNKETLAVCPFHLEFFLAKEQGMEMGMTAQGAYRAIQEREKEVSENQYMGSLMTLTDAMRLDYFKLLVEKKGTFPNLYDLFIEFYSQSDYGFSNLDRPTLDAIVKSKSPNEKRSTTMKLKKYPDTLTVYRGGNSASTPYEDAYSWTLDENTANFFAIRRGKGPAYIVKGEVSKKDVIEYIDGRNEEEVLVDPSKVKVIEIINLKGFDYLKEVLPKVAPMYHKYKETLEDLEYDQESSIHGVDHSARVLLMCLIMAEEMGLSMTDKKILATAAIYHDTKRTHDWVEPAHGKASKDYYHSDVTNPDPLVEFLCEYHCLPDEQGYQEIRNNRKLSKNREKSTRLFKVFKDADGLERVRLGNIRREMDMKQYRLPITKELTLVARLCLENVKL